MGTKWEYKVLESNPMTLCSQIEAALNKQGDDGWELIAVTPTVTGWFKFYFKRLCTTPA